jgi:hypothetical protein
MADFNWISEEDQIALEADKSGPEAEAAGRRWFWAAVLLALLATAVGFVYDRMQRRAETAVAAVEDQVLASHRLAEQAFRQGDVELLTSLLSGRDGAWSAAQQLLAESSHPIWDMTPLDEPGELVSLTLSDDLREAELVVDRRFARPNGETVVWRQTAVYRQGAEQWLFAPPLDDFWGGQMSERRGHLRLTYPKRDQQLVIALAERIEPELLEICRRLDGLTCSPGWVFDLYFSPDPAALAQWPPPLNAPVAHLPTPSLLGEPLDEAGWAALTAGYLEWLRPVVLADMVGWRCCDGLLLHTLLTHRQLAQLGHADWTLTAADFQELMAEPAPLELFAANWSHFPEGETAYWREAMAFIEYLLTAVPPAPVSPAHLQARLNGPPDFVRYLWSLGLSQAELAAGWYDFLDERAYQAAPPPASLPTAAAQLLCRNDDGRDLLLRWSLDQPRPLVELEDRRITQLRPLPDASGALVVETREVGDRTAFYNVLLHHAPQQPRPIISDIPNSFSLNLYEQPDPTSGQLVFYTFDLDFNAPTFEQVDLNLCAELDDCGLTDISGLPVWSPDGRQAIIMQLRRGVLALARQSADFAERPVQVGNGWSPFWLDNETYGFLRPQTVNDGGMLRSETHLVAALTDDDRVRLLADYSDIVAAIPADIRPDALTLNYAMTSPRRDGQIFMLGVDAPTGNLYLLIYERETSGVVLAEFLPGVAVAYPPIRFAPDGRWLTLNARLRDETRSLFLLYNIDSGAGQTYYFPLHEELVLPQWLPHWTVDGRWLLLPQGEHLALFAPDFGYETRLYYEDGLRCQAGVWVE